MSRLFRLPSFFLIAFTFFAWSASAHQTTRQLCNCLMSGDKEVLRQIEELCGNSKSVSVSDCFFTAVTTQADGLVRFLLTDKRVVGIEPDTIATALHNAAAIGYEKTLEVILKHGQLHPAVWGEARAVANQEGNSNVVTILDRLFAKTLVDANVPLTIGVLAFALYGTMPAPG